MSNADSVAQLYSDSFSNFKIASIRAQSLNTAGNAVISLPILSGGLTVGGAVANSGGIIVRRVTIQNPSGSVATANISIGSTNNGANLITANTVISSVSGVGTFQDITPTATATFVSGNTTACLYVNVNTASGNASTVDICVYGDVVSF